MSKRLPILLALALSACGDPPKKAPVDVPDFCQPSGQLTLLDEPEVYEHSHVTVHAAARVVSCDGGSSVAVDVDARMNGPDGGSIPVSLKVTEEPFVDLDGGLSLSFGSFMLDGGALVRADVTFETQEAGLYQLMLKFKPGLGNLQGELLAMVDRRAQGPAGITLPNLICYAFDLWGDLALCVSPALQSTELVMLRNGEVVERHQNDAFLVTDAGLWTVESVPQSTLSFWQLEGSEVRLAARTAISPLSNPWQEGLGPTMAGSGSSLLMVWQNQLLLAHRDGATISLDPLGTVPFIPGGASLAMVLREGEGALISEQNFGSMFPGVCVVSFADGSSDCRSDRFAIGADGDLLWVASTAGEVSALELLPGLMVVEHRTPYLLGTPGTPNLSQNVLALTGGGTFNFTLGTPFAGFSALFFTDSLIRIPILSDQAQVAGYGRWPQMPYLGATPRCFWEYDYLSQTLKYLPR